MVGEIFVTFGLIKIEEYKVLTSVLQNPNSLQQGTLRGHPFGQLSWAALYGGAGQLPRPSPAPSRLRERLGGRRQNRANWKHK